jgi:hypothetical protein
MKYLQVAMMQIVRCAKEKLIVLAYLGDKSAWDTNFGWY